MEENLNETNAPETEKKTALKAAWLYWSSIIVDSLIVIYGNAVKIGAFHIWITTAALIVSFVLGIAYNVLFFDKLIKIPKNKANYIIGLIAVILFNAYVVSIDFNCLYDTAAKPVEIVTNEYDVTGVYNYLEFIGEDGEKTSVRVTDEMKKELNGNEYISNSAQEHFSDNYLFYHKQNIRIKYYPRSRLLVELDFIE